MTVLLTVFDELRWCRYHYPRTQWRPSRRMRRNARKARRYQARCDQLTAGRHTLPGKERSYLWQVNHEYGTPQQPRS